MTDLIINKPSLQSLWQRFSSTVFTFVFWVIWFYLWIPVLTFSAWIVSIDMLHYQFFEMNGLQSIVNDLVFIISGVTALGGTLVVWASYNYIRFKGEDRRKAFAPVTADQLADAFGVDVSMLTDWQESKYLSLGFDGEGIIINIQQASLPDYQDDLIMDDLINDDLINDDLINDDLTIMPPPAVKNLTTGVGKEEESDISP